MRFLKIIFEVFGNYFHHLAVTREGEDGRNRKWGVALLVIFAAWEINLLAKYLLFSK